MAARSSLVKERVDASAPRHPGSSPRSQRLPLEAVSRCGISAVVRHGSPSTRPFEASRGALGVGGSSSYSVALTHSGRLGVSADREVLARQEMLLIEPEQKRHDADTHHDAEDQPPLAGR